MSELEKLRHRKALLLKERKELDKAITQINQTIGYLADGKNSDRHSDRQEPVTFRNTAKGGR